MRTYEAPDELRKHQPRLEPAAKLQVTDSMSFPDPLDVTFSTTCSEPRDPQSQAECQQGPSAPVEQDALPVGARLQEYEILRVLGEGGFGIVYLARDHSLLRDIAIKEYMPTRFACRGPDGRVRWRHAMHAEVFETGLRSFVNEAQLLAGFDHPALVKVHRYWEDNGTAYMAMQYYPGRTLKDERRAMAQPPDEAWLRAVVEPLLGALEVMHAHGVSHRDVAPDNVLLLPDGRPVLLDFGAARRVIGDRTQVLTSILKPSFASIEQYADACGMRQGPWTDLYALGAVLYYMLTAKAPTPAVVRAVHDDTPVLSTPGASAFGLSAHFARAIDWALAVHPQDRPQSVQAFRDAINGDLQPPAPRPRPSSLPPAAPAPALSANDSPQQDQRRPTDRTVTSPVAARRRSAIALTGAALCTVAIAAWTLRSPPADRPPSAVAAVMSEVPPAPVPLPVAAPLPGPAGAGLSGPTAVTAVAARPSKPVRLATAAPQQMAAPAQLPPGPNETCAERNALSKAVCLHRECFRPQFQQHPQCLQLKQEAEARRNEAANRL